MEIYISTSVNQPKLNRKLIKIISKYGNIINQGLIRTGRGQPARANPRQIHDQCVQKLERADVLVAEASDTGLNIGYTLGIAEQLDLPNVILCNSRQDAVSPVILGSRKLSIRSYQTIDQVKKILEKFLSEYQ